MSETNGEGYSGFRGGELLHEDGGETMVAGHGGANEQEATPPEVGDDMAQKEKEAGTFCSRKNEIMDARQLGGSEFFLNEGEFGSKEETFSAADAITHQSKRLLENNFGLTQELALGLFQELQSFLKEGKSKVVVVRLQVFAPRQKLSNQNYNS